MAIAAITTWTTNQVLTSTTLNGNFSTIRDHYNANAVETSGAQTIAGIKTFSAAAVFSAGFSTAVGITVVGNSTITGTLTALTGLTSSGTAALATVTASATITAGTGLTVTTGNLTMSGGQAMAKRVDHSNMGATETLDFDAGNIHRGIMDANYTFTLSNPRSGGVYTIELLQDATGSRTATWPAAVKWEGGTTPTLTTTASRKDVVILYYNGTNYDAVVFGLNFNDVG
jgi:hypothetical protein